MKEFSATLPISSLKEKTKIKDNKTASLNRILNQQIEALTKENSVLVQETKV